jgi:hypothetical protein
VFHFLVEPDDRAAYLACMRAGAEPGSGIIVATFAPDGPESCSGLPVVRYSAEELVAELGDGFEALANFHEIHTTPTGGVQPFTWVAGRLR